MTKKKSYLTFTDQFCGAGGSSIGAQAAGLEGRMALNHWQLAIDTHQQNFPQMDHDCADISACDPRRYPSTDILITSPECTTHSPAGGNKHYRRSQRDLFIPHEVDPATTRSRATMWDVVRFAEYHKYRAIIVENVVEVVRIWPLFWTWWQAMEKLGYVGEMVSLNSMFALPTPQSRDRIYIIWTRAKNRRPDLAICPIAPCVKCGDVEALQTWKTGRRVGKYGVRNQYTYTCPNCRAAVTPYFYCALNALDFSITAERIGDRKRPLKARTLERVRYGLEKYGRRALQVTVNQTTGIACRVRGLDDPLFGMTTSNTTALVAPRLTPFLYVARENVKAKALLDASPALVASANQIGIVQGAERFAPFLVTQRTHSYGKPLDEPIPSMCTGQHHALIQPAAMLKLMGDHAVMPLDAVVPTQTTKGPQDALISGSPFLIQYYGNTQASGMAEGIPTCSTKDRHAIVSPHSIDVDDCYFRMIRAHEVGAAMAFPGTYIVLGTAGQQIKQFGNAVTPPAMAILIQRVIASLN